MRWLQRRGEPDLAYRSEPGEGPCVVFLGGFHSAMTGTKASALHRFCRERGTAFVRFDYRGHGESAGAFVDGSVGAWRDDALAVIDACSEGPLVLVGSSMGAWIMALVAEARPTRVAALVGIAAAPDFTEELIWPALTPAARRALDQGRELTLPDRYGDGPVGIRQQLLADGRRWRVLGRTLPVAGPVRLLHGLADADVPWQLSVRLAQCLDGDDVRVTLVRDGDHRLSRPADLELLCATVGEVWDQVRGQPRRS